MTKKTLWNYQIPEVQKNNQEIPKHLEVDVLIIGGGIAGISTLFELRNEKKNILLIDSGQIGMGVTSHTTGKLTYLQELTYHKLEKIFSFDTSYLYLESQMEAIKRVKSNVRKYNIDCNFEENTGITFTNQESEIVKFEKEQQFFDKVHLDYEVIHALSKDIPCCYGIKVSNTAVFNPVKYLYHLKDECLKKGKQIIEYLQATKLTKIGDQYEVTTDKNTILAKTVIVCTHYPFFVIPGFIPFKSHIENSFIVAAKVEKTESWNAITSNKPTHSFRYYQDQDHYFIYAGESSKPANHLDYEARMKELSDQLYLKFHKTPAFTWHTHDVMTNDSLPFIGRINAQNPNLLIATGFNKWGMTNGVLAGMILSDIVKGKENRYQDMMRPDRPINLEKIKNFFLDGYQNAVSYTKTKLQKNQPFYQDNVKITYENGTRIGIYRDDNGKLHKVCNVCPHMKCNLIFNYLDHTWDCPCHGSRFDIDGNVIEGPAVYNIKLDAKKDK